jgi:serine/threonine protein kinase
MIGRTLSHYKVLEKIGEGGMGEVYLAHDERLDRNVATKILPSGALADETGRRRFRKEQSTRRPSTSLAGVMGNTGTLRTTLPSPVLIPFRGVARRRLPSRRPLLHLVTKSVENSEINSVRT